VNTSAAAGGDIVTYTVSFAKLPRDYPVTLGIIDTLPPSLRLLTETITTNPFVAVKQATSQLLSLQADFLELDQGRNITVSYSARVIDCTPVISPQLALSVPTSISATRPVTLQELTNAVMVTPTTNLSTTSASLMLKVPACGVALPTVSKGEPPKFPQLENGDLSQGPGKGWQEISEPATAAIIYPRASIPPEVSSGNPSSYIAWLGGTPNSTNTLSQTVSLPSSYLVGLEFRSYTASAEPNCSGGDTATLFIRGGGTTREEKFPLCTSQDTEAWVGKYMDLSAFRGTAVTLEFTSKLNGSRNSNWFLSNFQLCSIVSNDTHVPPGTPKCKAN
jgi:uncharacterized repeat protein (TIGR01451 family)